ncbi:MAG: methylglutaconyl-CoA hydratase [Hyphomicrobiaceae bacterium]|jgi:methylglutaconyl-CoA hydratase
MSDAPVLWSCDARGVGTVTINRPDRNNAYNGALLQGLHDAMDALGQEAGLRAVVIKGNGRHFQAGADLLWLNETRDGSPKHNFDASNTTTMAVDRLNHLGVVTIALVQGFCVGGGTGLISACDVVVATEDAKFAISEARWGVTAAVIVPHLVDAIGARQVRRYALTCERFDAETAMRLGLVHEVVPNDQLDAKGEEILAALLECAPDAIAKTKALALQYSNGDMTHEELKRLIQEHSDKRQSDEAGEGLKSFAEKRAASWSPNG